jgi:hypothetical protein
VHEVWLRLFGRAKPHWPDRAYFFAAVGEAMRRILVENARRKKRLKRGGNLERVDIDKVELAAPLPDDECCTGRRLTRLAECEPRAAEALFLVGLTQNKLLKNRVSIRPSNARGLCSCGYFARSSTAEILTEGIAADGAGMVGNDSRRPLRNTPSWILDTGYKRKATNSPYETNKNLRRLAQYLTEP